MNRRALLKSLAGVAAVGAVAPVAAVQVSQLAPDDVIVLSFQEHISEVTRVRIEEMAPRVFGGRRVVVLEGGATMQIARFGGKP